jgi:hypothetical protein
MAMSATGATPFGSPQCAFSTFVNSRVDRHSAALGRPLSMVVALTAGLEGLISGARGEAEEEKGPDSPKRGGQRHVSRGNAGEQLGATASCSADSAARPIDDNNGFLVLPGRDGRALGHRHWGGLLGGRYCFKRLIGVGTFAQIMEAEDTLSQAEPKRRVAIKVTRAGMQGVGMQESQLLAHLSRCPGFLGANIVQASAAFPLADHWCMVMELMPGALPDVLRHVRPYSMPMPCMRKLALQLLLSLSFLSSHGVVHADIRPENVLLRAHADLSGGKQRTSCSGGRLGRALKVKLADLGNAFQVAESGVYHDDFELQTLSYRAPEVLYGLPFDTQIDMWSLGCVLVEVYIGRRLFDAFNRASAVSTLAKTLGPLPRHTFSAGRALIPP